MMKILLVDDEESIRTLVEHILVENGYSYAYASDGVEALEVFERENPDLVILDIMMPRMNGYDVCMTLRDRGSSVPIMFLTAKGDIVDKGIGFKLGADDYLVKPFAPQELLWRVEALLRRARPIDAVPQDGIIEYRGFRMDTLRRRVTVDGKLVDLTPKEFQLLHVLAQAQGQVFTRDQLISDVWGEEYVGSSTSITVIVRRIREKIEEDPSEPQYLQTVWHVGYRFGS